MKEIFPIKFTYHGICYEGRIVPETDADGHSYQVVLNNVYFGSMKKDNRHWLINEQRPPELADLVGFCIDNHYQQALQQ